MTTRTLRPHSWRGRLSFTAAAAFGLAVALASAAQAAPQQRTFTDWFNNPLWSPPQTTTAAYVDKIVALFPGLTAATSIWDVSATAGGGDPSLDTATGALSLVGSDIPNGYPTNIQFLPNLTGFSLTTSTTFQDATTLTSQLSNLTSLTLTGNTGLVDITGLTCAHLTTLVLASNGNGANPPNVGSLSDPSIPGTCTALTSLDLSNNSIQDLGTAHGYAGLPSLPALTSLNLSKNPIDDLTALPALPALKELNLSGLTHLSGVDIHLGALSQYASTLTSLDLSGSQVVSPERLEALTNLTYLNLSGNQIQDPAALESMTNLKLLDLRNNNIDDKAVITALRVALPNTTILLAGNPILPSFAITTPTALPDGTVGVPYSFTLTAEDLQRAAVAATWDQADGQLPPGLSLNPATGVISGTPTVAGTFKADINAAYGGQVDDPPFTVRIRSTSQEELPATGTSRATTAWSLSVAGASLSVGLVAVWLRRRSRDAA